MTDRVDIDPPADILAALGRTSAAATGTAGHVSKVAGGFTVSGSRDSALDTALERVVYWLSGAFSDAAAAESARSIAIDRTAKQVLRNLVVADALGGQAVDRSREIL